MGNMSEIKTRFLIEFVLAAFLVLLVGLKLSGQVAWSWWWVMSPVFVWVSIWLCLFLAVGVVALWSYPKRKKINKETMETLNKALEISKLTNERLRASLNDNKV